MNEKVKQAGFIFFQILSFIFILYWMAISIIWAQDVLNDINDMKEGNINYELYGLITDIKSISAGGFGSSTKCIVDINNISVSMSGDVCNKLKQGEILYKAETRMGEVWRIGEEK